MADTIREQILKQLSYRLGDNALRTSAVEFFDPDNPVAIRGLVDLEDTTEKIEYGSTFVSMEVRAERVEELTTNNRSSFGNELLGYIIADITGTDRTLGGICHTVDYANGGIILTPESLNFMGAFATFVVRFSFDTGNPYTNSNPV